MSNAFMKLPIEERYRILGRMRAQTSMSYQDIGALFGVHANTVRNAEDYCHNPRPLPKTGRPTLLKEHHLEYIKLRTANDPKMTNETLARATSILSRSTYNVFVCKYCRKGSGRPRTVLSASPSELCIISIKSAKAGVLVPEATGTRDKLENCGVLR